MSSYNDASIDLTRITNRRTTTLPLNLAAGSSRVYDLTLCQFGGLDFDPDYVIVKYISYSSQNSNPADAIPILTCDFIVGDVLVPYLARTCIQSFDIIHKVNFKVNKQYATITSKSMTNAQQNLTYNNGTILIALEWIRYARKTQFFL